MEKSKQNIGMPSRLSILLSVILYVIPYVSNIFIYFGMGSMATILLIFSIVCALVMLFRLKGYDKQFFSFHALRCLYMWLILFIARFATSYAAYFGFRTYNIVEGILTKVVDAILLSCALFGCIFSLRGERKNILFVISSSSMSKQPDANSAKAGSETSARDEFLSRMNKK